MKDFAEKLKEYLRSHVNKWTDIREGAGGCDTCGYGAEEYEVVDWEGLDKEIDEFCASFKKDES